MSGVGNSIESMCEAISRGLGDARLAFQTVGEKKSWEDLRVCHFVFVHDEWDFSMGELPTFGCYSQTCLSDAILDIRTGRVSRWIKETSLAIALYHEMEYSQNVADRVRAVFGNRELETPFEAALLCSMFTGGNRTLAKMAWDRGQFFTFKVDPGSKFSPEVQALFIEEAETGFYKKWWAVESELVQATCMNRQDLVAHARLNPQDLPTLLEADADTTKSLMKRAWGL